MLVGCEKRVEQHPYRLLFLGIEQHGRFKGQLQFRGTGQAILTTEDQVVAAHREGYRELAKYPERRFAPPRFVEAQLVRANSDPLRQSCLGEPASSAQFG